MKIDMCINLIKELIDNKSKISKFDFKDEFCEIRLEFSSQVRYKDIDVEPQLIIKEKDIIDSEIVDNNMDSITNNENFIIKSKYVAIIKLKDKNGKYFIKKGEKVQKGDKIAEYEYLNILLDLKSPHNGIIEKILVNDEEFVDYNKHLFILNKE